MKLSGIKRTLTLSIAGAVTLSMAACSGANPPPAAPLPQVGKTGGDGVVVKSRATIPVLVSASGEVIATGPVQVAPTPKPTSATQPVTVTNAGNTTMSIDNTQWKVPTIANTVADFGVLTVANLFDNDLDVCGAAANAHCGAAILRTYTTGTAGPGIWNAAGNYGVPLMASLDGMAPFGTVGMNPQGALVLEHVDLPASKHVVRLSDFAPPPRFNYQADFADAGAGPYATTLVIEYVLATTVTPAPSPTVTPTPSPTVTPVPSPTVTPTPSPTVTPAPRPTIPPVPSPTASPRL